MERGNHKTQQPSAAPAHSVREQMVELVRLDSQFVSRLVEHTENVRRLSRSKQQRRWPQVPPPLEALGEHPPYPDSMSSALRNAQTNQ